MVHGIIHMGASIEKLWVMQASTIITGKENVKVTLFIFLFMKSCLHLYIMWIQYSLPFCVLVFVFSTLKLVTFVNGYIKLQEWPKRITLPKLFKNHISVILTRIPNCIVNIVVTFTQYGNLL